MKRGEEENYTLPVLNIPYLSSSRNIKFPREISSYFTANSPYFAAKKNRFHEYFFFCLAKFRADSAVKKCILSSRKIKSG